MQQYKVIREIVEIKAIHNGAIEYINIPIGTICTEEIYGTRNIDFVYCTINGIEYHGIPFPPYIFRETDGEAAYVEPYI